MVKKSSRKSHNSFSIIELSIVLVVISVLLTMFVKFNQIKRNYELKSMMNEIFELDQAVRLFKGKYNTFPGLLTNATTILSADTDNSFTSGVSHCDVTPTESCKNYILFWH